MVESERNTFLHAESREAPKNGGKEGERGGRTYHAFAQGFAGDGEVEMEGGHVFRKRTVTDPAQGAKGGRMAKKEGEYTRT